MIELRRGDIVLYGERGEYTGKLRPGVVLQRDSTLDDAPSVTLCGLTSLSMPAHGSRVAVSPTPLNGLDTDSHVMADKIVSISRKRIRIKLGILGTDEQSQVDLALRRWLGL